MHAAQFSKTAAPGRRDSPPEKRLKRQKKGLSPERPHRSRSSGSVWALDSRTLLSRSASSATEEYSAARHDAQCPRRAGELHRSALDAQSLVTPLANLHHGSIEAVDRQVEL